MKPDVFDPGPAPPEPARDMSASEADTMRAETFRERALRRAKEIEAIQNAKPGDTVMVGGVPCGVAVFDGFDG